MATRPDIDSCSTVLQVVYGNIAGVRLYLDKGTDYALIRARALLGHIAAELEAVRVELAKAEDEYHQVVAASGAKELPVEETRDAHQHNLPLFPGVNPVPCKVEFADHKSPKAEQECQAPAEAEVEEKAPAEAEAAEETRATVVEEDAAIAPAAEGNEAKPVEEKAKIVVKHNVIHSVANMDAYYLLQFMLQNSRGRTYVREDYASVLQCGADSQRLMNALSALTVCRRIFRSQDSKGNAQYRFMYHKSAETLCETIHEVLVWLKANYATGLTLRGLLMRFPRCGKLPHNLWARWLVEVLAMVAQQHGEEVDRQDDRFRASVNPEEKVDTPSMVVDAAILNFMDLGSKPVSQEALYAQLKMPKAKMFRELRVLEKHGLIGRDGHLYTRISGSAKEDIYAWKTLACEFIKNYEGKLTIKDVLREVPFPGKGTTKSKMEYNIAQVIRYYGKE